MKCVLVSFVVLVLSTLVACDPYQCASRVTDKDGNVYQYNLTSLYHEPQLSDSLYYMSDAGDLTYFNICGDTTTVCSPASPVCRRSGLWSTLGFGDLETQTFKPIDLPDVAPDHGITVEYTLGEYCPNTQGTSAIIHIICSNEKNEVTNAYLSDDNCTLIATIESPAGCGVLVSSGSSYSSGSGSSDSSDSKSSVTSISSGTSSGSDSEDSSSSISVSLFMLLVFSFIMLL